MTQVPAAILAAFHAGVHVVNATLLGYFVDELALTIGA